MGGIAFEAEFLLVKAGHESSSGRGADASGGVVIVEDDSRGGEFVDVRSFDVFAAVVTEITIAEIICEDEDDVGGGWGGGGGGRGGGPWTFRWLQEIAHK